MTERFCFSKSIGKSRILYVLWAFQYALLEQKIRSKTKRVVFRGAHKELDDFHAQARPDYFVYRSKDEIYPRDAFIHNLTHPGCLELGVFEGEQIVGVANATLWEESGMIKGVKTVCLDNIYVLPVYRRKGIAAKLFAEVEGWAKDQGAVRLDVYTWDFNEGAIAMYQTMGMTPQQHVFEKKL